VDVQMVIGAGAIGTATMQLLADDVASKGAAWPAPSIRCVLAVGMAAASDPTRRAMLLGLRAP
jgi:hypothetical protein